MCAADVWVVEQWTSWALLVALALYDLCAVLTPCGPLRALVRYPPLAALHRLQIIASVHGVYSAPSFTSM